MTPFTITLVCAAALYQDPGAAQRNELLSLHRAADMALLAGELPAAHEAFEAALMLAPEDPTLAYGMACVRAREGREELALDWLERAVERGYEDDAVARWDADLASLREQPRFLAALSRMSLSGSAPALWTFECRARGAARQGPLGERIAIAGESGSLQLIERSSGRLVHALDDVRTTTSALAFSPDGAVLASTHTDGTLARWDVASGALLSESSFEPDESAPPMLGLDYIADGARILVRHGARLLLWSSSGEPIDEFEIASAWWQSAAWSPAGDRIAHMQGEQVLLRDALTGALLEPPFSFPEPCTGLEFSPDGARLCVGTSMGGVRLLDMQSGEELWSAVATDDATASPVDLWGEPLAVRSVHFSPSGERLAICTTSGFFVHVYDSDSGRLLWRSTHLGGRMGSPMPISCGEQLLIADGGDYLFEAASGREAPRGSGARGRVDHGPGGRVLIGGGERFALLDETRGLELYSRAVLPDGRVLLLHASGWFAGDVQDPAALSITRRSSGKSESRPLDVADFDPKRIRAAQAGVPLLSAPLR